MENAKIFLVDDEEEQRSFSKQVLEDAGHQVVLQASSRAEALEAIKSGRLTELGVNVAVVDGWLETESKSPVDGMVVSRTILAAGLPIKVVAHTSLPKNQTFYGHEHAWKVDGAKGLLNAVAAL